MCHIAHSSELKITIQRLISETRVWSMLDHPNIQPYLGYCPNLGLSVALVSPLYSNSSIMKYTFNNPSVNKLQLVSRATSICKWPTTHT
jgi:hypothetical protein